MGAGPGPLYEDLASRFRLAFAEIRAGAVRSLGKRQERHVVSAIVALLGDAMASLRKEAAVALGEVADPAARQGLEGTARDPDLDMRRTARGALERLPA